MCYSEFELCVSLKSVSLGIEYCKYLLGQEAGMPFCLGLAGRDLDSTSCLDKNLVGKTEGSVVCGGSSGCFPRDERLNFHEQKVT